MRFMKLILIVPLLLAAVHVQAAPYEFSKELDYYTWGEDLSQVKEDLGEPYSQDPGGLTYLLSGNWMKQVLTYQGKVYQIIERIIYSLEDPAAEKEYMSIKGHLVELYGPPSQEDIACPNPTPQIKCRISRWDAHPSTQVFVAINEDKIISVMLGVTSRELREQALSEPEAKSTLSVGQVIGAFQQNQQQAAGKYLGQNLKIMGQAGGLVKTEDGRFYLRVLNAFNHQQQVHCYLAEDYGSMGPPPDGAIIAEGPALEYKARVLILSPCTFVLPAE